MEDLCSIIKGLESNFKRKANKTAIYTNTLASLMNGSKTNVYYYGVVTFGNEEATLKVKLENNEIILLQPNSQIQTLFTELVGINDSDESTMETSHGSFVGYEIQLR